MLVVSTDTGRQLSFPGDEIPFFSTVAKALGLVVEVSVVLGCSASFLIRAALIIEQEWHKNTLLGQIIITALFDHGWL